VTRKWRLALMLDFIGALTGYLLWRNDLISIWGLILLILAISAIAAGLTYKEPRLW